MQPQRVDVGPSALCLSFTRRRSSPQRNLDHVGWRPAGPTQLTRATRNGRWTSDWACCHGPGPVRMVRNLELVGWCPPGPRHWSQPPGYGRSTASQGPDHRSQLPGYGRSTASADSAGPRPPIAATWRTKPGGLVTKDHGPANPYPDGSPDSRLVPYGTGDQTKASGDPAYLAYQGRWTMD